MPTLERIRVYLIYWRLASDMFWEFEKLLLDPLETVASRVKTEVYVAWKNPYTDASWSDKIEGRSLLLKRDAYESIREC